MDTSNNQKMRYQIYEAKSVKHDAQQRVGIVPFGLDVPKKPVFMRVSGLGTFRVTVFATDKIVTLGLQLNLKIA